MTPLQFFTGTESPEQVLTVLAGGLGIFGLVIFYFTMIKPFQDEKKESQSTGRQDTVPSEPDPYEGVIDEYPTYPRNK